MGSSAVLSEGSVLLKGMLRNHKYHLYSSLQGNFACIWGFV